MLKIDLEYESKILFIRLNGSLDKKKTYKINNYIVPVIKKHKIKNVIMNLSNIKRIDSSGVEAIVNVKATTKNNNGTFYLCEVSNDLLSMFKKLRISHLKSERTAKLMLEV